MDYYHPPRYYLSAIPIGHSPSSLLGKYWE